MVITKRMFTLLVVLAAAGVAAVMYAALLATGVQGTASTAAAPTGAPEPQPVTVTLDASQLEGLCQPVVIDGDGGSVGETNTEIGDFATNSGTIAGSQFNDGGFGDIGQQWWQVTVAGPVTNVHVGGDGSSANVTVTVPGPSGSGSGSGAGSGASQTPSTTSPTTTTPTTTPAEESTEETTPEG
jgi:hypothetical protein